MNLPETDTLGKQLLRHQAGKPFVNTITQNSQRNKKPIADCPNNHLELAIKRFASLADVSSIVADTNLTDLSIERLRSKKDLLTEVHSTQLPLLKEQITLISDALGHPDQVRNDPGPTIQRVLEIQPILEQTLDQTIRAIHEILPGVVPPPEQTYDRHFRELKCFRLHGLNRVFRGRFASDVNTFFLACKRRIEILQLSTSDDGQGPVDSSHLVESSDIVIRLATSPELDIIYAVWEEGLLIIDDAFADLFVIACSDNPFSFAVTMAAKSFILVFRLSRLFFKKLLRDGMTNQEVPFCTEMSSQQLDSLQNAVSNIVRSIFDLVASLQNAEAEDDAEEEDEGLLVGTRQAMLDHIGLLLRHFRTCLFLADLYIIPIISDINVPSSQNYFKTWFIDWNTLFSRATHDAYETCHSYLD
ncbi:hypothetical protein Pst134EA_015999 [Puccinia striiformis f. sp. tritici]|nr:hypothetical protein Pst134EA_015999 [Puccinia striiformis f. sp. tritici]KAH9463918.1 hypothetical protein Pst134EA_015999 [Puccinia striiformis f. sp. tritici]